jgi:hypothetical protein
MKSRLVLVIKIIGVGVSLGLLGCAGTRLPEGKDTFAAIAEQLEMAHKKLSLLRDRYEEEHPTIQSQWEIIAALERGWIGEVRKAHRSLEVIDGGSPWTTEVQYTLADDHLLVQERGPRGRKSASAGTNYIETQRIRCIILAPDAAKAVWGELERLRITEWNEKYSPADLNTQISDGTRWGVFLRVGHAEKRSVGNNVYPSLSPLGMPQLLTQKDGHQIVNAYTALLTALHSYAEKSNKAPTPASGTVPPATRL